jgi:hypothetical protein
MMKVSLLLAIVCTVWGCASIKPPPGGDEDKTPPTVDTTFPSIGATNVPKDIKPRIIFEQNVDRSSLTQSVTITPYMPGVIKYDWSGYDEVELELPEPLRDSTTYILTIGRDLKTRRNGMLASPIQLIFSTGPTLDSGIIAGQVFPGFQAIGEENFTNLFVFAYDISTRSADTLNVSVTRPDYITQPSSTGAFELRALKIGHAYRVIAVSDEFRNRLYDHATDSYGVPTGDVELSPNTIPSITIRMVPKIDTVRPKIEDVEVRDLYHFRVKFNKAVDSASVLESNFELVREGDQSPLILVSAYIEDPEKRPAVITLVTRDPLHVGASYTLHALNNNIRDLRGLTMGIDAASTVFTVPPVPDSFLAPRLLWFSISDSIRNISRLPDIRAFLSDAGRRSTLNTAFLLYDSIGRSVPIEVRHSDASHVTVRPRDTLLPLAYYRLEVKGLAIVSAVPGYSDRAYDSTYILNFFTEDPRDFGSVSGEILYSDSLYNPASHRIVIQLVNTETNIITTKVLSEGRSKFTFEHVPAGRYKVRAWLAGSEGNVWFGGKLFPFVHAMPTGEYVELIDVRSRWSVDGVNFELK